MMPDFRNRASTVVKMVSLWMLLALALCNRSLLVAADGPSVRPPNVIMILTDDQRWNALGCMGNELIRTPHIDRLAADGVVFENMFCTTSICAVSRTTFLTGQYARRHGIHDFSKALTPKQFSQTFPAVLRRAGYRTGFVGKWGLAAPLPKSEYDSFQGFLGQGRYFEPGDKESHLTDKLGAQTLEFIETCSNDQPFLLQLSTKAAHCLDGDPWPFQPAPRYQLLYNDVVIPPQATADDEHFQGLPEFLRTSEARVRWEIRFKTPELYQKSVKDYYRLITGVDDLVGNVVAKLKEKHLDQNTVILFTSDNGFYLGDRGLAGKWFMHEESIRLPLVIYDPRLPAMARGQRVSQLVLNLDIAPTIIDLAGLTPPDVMQGQSLVPLMRQKSPEWRTEFFYEHLFRHKRIPQSEGVRTDRWKYVRYISLNPVHEELYDLQNDPLEERNLAKDPQFKQQLDNMRTKWMDWLQAAQ